MEFKLEGWVSYGGFGLEMGLGRIWRGGEGYVSDFGVVGAPLLDELPLIVFFVVGVFENADAVICGSCGQAGARFVEVGGQHDFLGGVG